MIKHFSGPLMARSISLSVGAAMLAPTLAGCGGAPQQPAAPANFQQRPGMMQQRPAMQSGGMSTKKKLVLIAGAAALYYLYKKHQAKSANDKTQGAYFKSEANGRVYYRDLKSGKFQYVSPPTQAFQVPEAEAQQYGLNGYQGYPGAQGGQKFGGYGAQNTDPKYRDAEPAPVPSGTY